MMRRLDLRTALRLQDGHHVTSPYFLKSILENGITPGGSEGKKSHELLRSISSVGQKEQIHQNPISCHRRAVDAHHLHTTK